MTFPTVPIEDVCSLIVDCVNKTAPKVSYETPWKMLRTPNVRNGRVNTQDVSYVDEDTFKTWTRRATLEIGDTILTREAPVGEVGLLREADGFFLGQRLMQYRADPKIMDGLFLNFAMRSPILTNQFHAFGGTGSVVDHLKVPDCRRFLVPSPPLEIQREIAAILGALDDKIELNRKTAATLEEMARALYRSWFVDFDPMHARSQGLPPAHMSPTTAALFPASFGEDGLPEGWKAGTLSDLSALNSKKHSKKSHPEALDYVDLSNTKWGLIETTTPYSWEEAPSRAKMILSAGDTIVGTVRPGNGSYSYIGFDGLTGSTGFAVLSPKEMRDSGLVYLAATDTDTIDTLTNLADGGAYPAVRPDVVAAQSVCIASDALRLAFSEQAQPFIEKIEANKLENQTLATLRDTLLPRLMSGELRVGEAREQIKEAL